MKIKFWNTQHKIKSKSKLRAKNLRAVLKTTFQTEIGDKLKGKIEEKFEGKLEEKFKDKFELEF